MPIKIDPWSESIPHDYARMIEEFGIESFESMIDRIPDPNHLMRRKIVFGHRDFGRILEAIQNGNDYIVMTGLMPSGRMHLGHKLVVDQLIWHLDHGAKIYLCVADLESHMTRGLSLKEARDLAIEEYLVNFQALKLDLNKCYLYFQSHSNAVKQLAFTLGGKVNFSELKAIYGFAGDSNASQIFYPMIDVADILHPQLDDFEGPGPSVVPVGIDQDPHIRLARDVAGRFQREFGFVPPSSTYNRLVPGLMGEKMSSSRPKGVIFLTDTIEEIKSKVLNAVTGGGHTVKEQRKEGGNPDECSVYSLYVFHLIPDDEKLLELRESCESGELICGDCKDKAIKLLRGFLEEHRDAREKARDEIKEILESELRK
ncbi:tryptophanyl-tRNA synthetase [candidate division MSBL1 archaeon SCGC-AAA261F19]|uniref:Tryptophan--tRNA ligase n=2 Tax=candidate division MSBL1 TaxID=215777 RepID=A0A133V9H1_9EURY|nr:tryptophanyl-tRNA synthetase [candidate division MSBL1 archaeon SCGC-AAA261D19]KXB03108.1 tryptophanyl-tRNA synthetase [candidate division MSBL1 archaeon SCGC-AAA261F19]